MTSNSEVLTLLDQQLQVQRDRLRAMFERAVIAGSQTPGGAQHHARTMVAALPWYADQDPRKVEVPVASAAVVLTACLYAAARGGDGFGDIRTWLSPDTELLATEVRARIGDAPEAEDMLAAFGRQLGGSFVVAGRAISEAHHALDITVDRFMDEIPSGKTGVVQQHLRTLAAAKDLWTYKNAR